MRKQGLLYFGKDIPLNNTVSVQQPTIEDVIVLGEENFARYVLPFTITLESIFDEGFDTSSTTIFNLLFEKAEDGKYVLDGAFGTDTMDLLKDSISFFTGVDRESISVLSNRKKIVVKDSYIIDNSSFIEFRKIIQAITVRNDLEVERPPKNMSKRKLDIWNKLQEGRRRKALREGVKLEDMANYISFGGKNYIPSNVILKMKYFEFHNAYSSIISMDSYETGMAYKLSQKYDVKDEIKHWTKTLRISSDID